MTSPNPQTNEDDALLLAASRDVPFLDLLGARPVSAGQGRAEFELTVDTPHLRTLGLLHGGVTASLLDTAMGFAAVTKAPPGHHVVTIQLSVNFISPSWKAETLRATAEIQHCGRKTAVTRGEIRNETDKLIATATGTFMFLPIENESTAGESTSS